MELPPAVLREFTVFSLELQIGQSICLYIDIQLEKKPVENGYDFVDLDLRDRERCILPSLRVLSPL